MRIRLRKLAALLAATTSLGACSGDRTRGLDARPVAPATLDFGNLAVGSTTRLPLSVVNQGALSLKVNDGVAPEPFNLDSTPGDPIDPGGSGDLLVAFAPISPGEVTGSLVINTSSVVQPSVTVQLHGVAFSPELSPSPQRLDFGDVTVGQSKTLTFDITDKAPVPLTPDVEPADPTGDFGVSPQGYLAQLQPLASETVSVSFTPSAAGPAQSQVLLSCAICPLRQIAVTGNGVAGAPPAACALTATPARLDFGTIDAGRTATGTVTLQSAGSGTCFVKQPYTSAATDRSLSFAGLQMLQLAPGQSVQLTGTFAPTATTPLQVNGGLVLVSNDKDNGVLTVPLTGGVTPPAPPPPPPPPPLGQLKVAPSSLAFSAQAPTAPASQTLTVSNSGGQDLKWAGSSDDAALTVSPALGALAPGQSAQLTVQVAAQATAGTRAQTLSFTAGTAGSASVAVQITFTAAPPPPPPPDPGKLVVSPPAIAFTAQVPSAPPVRGITLANTGGQPFTWGASADDAAVSLSLAAGTLVPGATQAVLVSVAGQASAGARTRHLTVSAGIAGSATVELDIDFTAAPPPPPPPPPGQITVTPPTLSFTAQTGVAPVSQQLTVGNAGGQALSWTAASNDATITLSVSSGSLQPGSTSRVTVSVAAQPVAGDRVQSIVFDAGTAGSVEVPIDLFITSPPPPPPPPNPALLVVKPLLLTFTAQAPAAPAAQSVTLLNSGGLGLSWTAVADDAAVSLSAATGQLAAGNSSSLSVAVAGQPYAGARVSHLTVDAGAAGHAVVELDINFTSAPPPPPPQYGNSVWPKWHQGNTNTGLSTVDTSGTQGVPAWSKPAHLGPPRGCIDDGRTNNNLRCGTYLNSPVLADDGTVYQLAGDGKFYALDRATGRANWVTPTQPPWIAAMEGTPTVVKDGSIFLMTAGESGSTSQVFHLGRDGHVIWQNQPGLCAGNRCDGYDSSPALGNDGTIYLANDDLGTVDAFDQAGNRVGSVALSPLSDIETQSGALAPDDIGYWSANGHLWALSKTAQLWSFTEPIAAGETDWNPPASFYNRKSSPAVTADGQVIFAWAWSHGDGTYSTRVYSFKAGNKLVPLWQRTLGPNKPVTGLAGGPGLAANDADMLHYRNGLTSPAVGPDGTIYVGHVNGLYALDGKTGAVKRSVGMSEVVGSPAVGADGTVYVGSMDGNLYAIKDGVVRWQFPTNGQLNSSPAIGADGTIYVMSDDGYLYAVK